MEFRFQLITYLKMFLEQRHRDRVNLIIGKEVDNRGIGYNTNQSKIAISNGGFFGAGFLQRYSDEREILSQDNIQIIYSVQ